jgi:metal-responsive CopG/Arc/MetJ family transcriptional regulator
VETPEESGTTVVSVRLPDDLLRWIDQRAQEEDRNRGNMIIRLLKQERSRLGEGDFLSQIVNRPGKVD